MHLRTCYPGGARTGTKTRRCGSRGYYRRKERLCQTPCSTTRMAVLSPFLPSARAHERHQRPMRQELNAAWRRFRDDTDALIPHSHRGRTGLLCWCRHQRGRRRWHFCRDILEKRHQLFESGLELLDPTRAAINGPCLGYAVTAVSFCDFVIASDVHVRLSRGAYRRANDCRRHPHARAPALSRRHGTPARRRSGRRDARPGDRVNVESGTTTTC